MSTQSDDRDNRRAEEHNARVILFQILCALETVSGAGATQPEIESRFEELFVCPDPEAEMQEVPESDVEPELPEVPETGDEEAENIRVPFEAFRAVCAQAVKVLQMAVQADELIDHYSTEWKAARMTIVARTAVRIAVCEAFISKTTPVKVALNEAVIISKEFGGEETSRFVNGVLGRIAKAVEQ